MQRNELAKLKHLLSYVIFHINVALAAQLPPTNFVQGSLCSFSSCLIRTGLLYQQGKYPYVARFFLKNTLSCSSTDARTHVADENLVYGGWVFFRGSPASIQTCIVKRPVNTRLSGADSANTRPRLVVPPVAAGNTQLLFRPGGSETCRGFSSRYNIRSEARNSLPSQLLPSYLKVDS